MALKECKECNAKVSTKAKKCPACGVNNPTVNSQDMKKAFFSGAAMILGFIFLMASLSEGGTQRQYVPKPRIESMAITKMTKEVYPKTFKEWGAEKFELINSLSYLAADYVLINHYCETLVDIFVSTDKSTPPNKIVFYAHCLNGGEYKTYYVSQEDLNR